MANTTVNEFELKPKSGWTVLPLLITAALADIAAFVLAVNRLNAGRGQSGQWVWGVLLGLSLLSAATIVVLCRGFFAVSPNAAVVTQLFGVYKGSVRRPGFHWANPFFNRIRLSLRVRNMNTETLKVNDIRGNPIEIAAVVVWRIVDTYRAVFEVDDYKSFVSVQSESALRHLASVYPYDTGHEGEGHAAAASPQTTLRGSLEEVSKTLQVELQNRLNSAGVVVDEARLSHLAYAPEIAGAMLRRQQAEAVVAARYRIVEGAVGMVEAALEHLAKSNAVTLDDERKAAMVSNLMVVLCGDHGAQPVVNAGSLY